MDFLMQNNMYQLLVVIILTAGCVKYGVIGWA